MLDPSEAWLLRVINTNTLGALALLFWDALLTFDDEIKYIWAKPSCLTKWLFLYIRYWGLTIQIIVFSVASNFPLNPYECTVWYAAQACIAQSMMSAVEAVLMLRVYALYNRSRRVLILLGFFFVTEIVIVAMNARHNIPNMVFTSACFTTLAPGAVVYYALAILSTQLVIISLTLYKRPFGDRKAWGRTPLVQTVMRDGTLSFIIMFALLFLDVMYVAMQNDVAFALVYWFYPLLSVAGCRLILNIQQLGKPQKEDESFNEIDAQFTTVFSV